MRFFTLFLIAGLLSAPAWADTLPEECRLLGAHKPGSGMVYQPGVDVHGNPVAPADLNDGTTIDLPDVITVPLTIDLAQRLQNSHVEGLQLEAPLGLLEIHKNGRVVYNGQDWTPQIYALCGKEAPVLPPRKPSTADNGQKAADAIKSETPSAKAPPAIPPGSVEIEGGEARQEGYK